MRNLGTRTKNSAVLSDAFSGALVSALMAIHLTGMAFPASPSESFAGLSIGMGNSGLWSDDSRLPHSTKRAASGGLLCEVGLNRFFRVGTGIFIAQKGFSVANDRSLNSWATNENIDLNYLFLPLMTYAIFPSFRNCAPYLCIGTGLNILLREKQSAAPPNLMYRPGSVYNGIAFYDVTLPVGAGIEFSVRDYKFGVEASYAPGLSTLKNDTLYTLQANGAADGISLISAHKRAIRSNCFLVNFTWLVSLKRYK